MWVLLIMKHWVFLFPTVPLGCLSICLPVCYCIRGTLASAMLNNASHLAKSLLALRQSRRSQRRAWIQETMSRDFSPVKWNLNSELQVIREENTETTWNTAVQCWCLSYFHLKFPPYSFFFFHTMDAVWKCSRKWSIYCIHKTDIDSEESCGNFEQNNCFELPSVSVKILWVL